MSKRIFVDVLAIGAQSAVTAAHLLAARPILSLHTLLQQAAYVPEANYAPFVKVNKTLPLLKERIKPAFTGYDDVGIKEINPKRNEVMLMNGTQIVYKLLIYAGRQVDYFSQEVRKGLENQQEAIYSLSIADQFLFNKHQSFAQRYFGKVGYFFPKKPYAFHQEIDILQKIEHWKKLNVTNLPFSLTVFAEDQLLLPDFPQASKKLQEILVKNKVELKLNYKPNFQQDCKLGMDSLCVRLGREHYLMQQANVNLDDYDPSTLRLNQFNNIFIPSVHCNSYVQMQSQVKHAVKNIRRLISSAGLIQATPKVSTLWLMDGEGGMRLPNPLSTFSRWRRKFANL